MKVHSIEKPLLDANVIAKKKSHDIALLTASLVSGKELAPKDKDVSKKL